MLQLNANLHLHISSFEEFLPFRTVKNIYTLLEVDIHFPCPKAQRFRKEMCELACPEIYGLWTRGREKESLQ